MTTTLEELHNAEDKYSLVRAEMRIWEVILDGPVPLLLVSWYVSKLDDCVERAAYWEAEICKWSRLLSDAA